MSEFGNKKVFVIVSFLASLITIIIFVSGKESLPQIFGGKQTSTPASNKNSSGSSSSTNGQSFSIDGLWKVSAVDIDEFGYKNNWSTTWEIKNASKGIQLYEISDGLLNSNVEEIEVLDFSQKGRNVLLKTHTKSFPQDWKTIKLEFMEANSLKGTFVSKSSASEISLGLEIATKGSIEMSRQ